MRRKFIAAGFIGLVAGLSLLLATPISAEELAAPLTLKRLYDPVEILGRRLPSVLGKPLDRMALLAFKNGKPEYIPFEFDERNKNNQFVFPEGPYNNAKDANYILDAQDFLVFMVSDCGNRVLKGDLPKQAAQTVEIELYDPLDQTRGWVYLILFPDRIALPRFKPKVTVPDKDTFAACGHTWCFEGMTRMIGGKKYNTIIQKGFSTLPEGGGNGKNILDRLKTRGRLSLLFGMLNFDFNEDISAGGVFAQKMGAIRGFGCNWTQMTLTSGVKGPKFWLDTYVYDYMIYVPVYFRVFFNPGYVITSGRMAYGYDLNENARGMKFYNSNNLEGFTIDGKMSEEERRFNPAMDTWRLITGPQGTLIQSSFWDPKFVKQVDVEVVYSDDLNVKRPPEFYPGDFGYFGFRAEIESLAAGNYDNLLGFFMPPNFYSPHGLQLQVIQEFFNIREHPLEISIDQAPGFKNTGGFPAPLH